MWYNDPNLVRGFGEALSNAGMLEDSDDFAAFLRKPQRYNSEYDAWESCGYPTGEDEDGWDDFVEQLSNSDEDDDDETE